MSTRAENALSPDLLMYATPGLTRLVNAVSAAFRMLCVDRDEASVVRKTVAMSDADRTAIAQTYARAVEAIHACGEEAHAAKYGAKPISKKARHRAIMYLLQLHGAVPILGAPEIAPTTDGAILAQWVVPKTTRGEVTVELLFFADKAELHIDFADQDDDPIEQPLEDDPTAFMRRLRELIGPHIAAA